jgi:hypothetical protein
VESSTREILGTHDCWFRLSTTIIGFTIPDAWKALRYGVEQASIEGHRHDGLCHGCYQGNLSKQKVSDDPEPARNLAPLCSTVSSDTYIECSCIGGYASNASSIKQHVGSFSNGAPPISPLYSPTEARVDKAVPRFRQRLESLSGRTRTIHSTSRRQCETTRRLALGSFLPFLPTKKYSTLLHIGMASCGIHH